MPIPFNILTRTSERLIDGVGVAVGGAKVGDGGIGVEVGFVKPGIGMAGIFTENELPDLRKYAAAITIIVNINEAKKRKTVFFDIDIFGIIELEDFRFGLLEALPSLLTIQKFLSSDVKINAPINIS